MVVYHRKPWEPRGYTGIVRGLRLALEGSLWTVERENLRKSQAYPSSPKRCLTDSPTWEFACSTGPEAGTTLRGPAILIM